MGKDLDTSKVPLALNSPRSSQPESSGASSLNRWSILDSVAQQLDTSQGSVPPLAGGNEQATPWDAPYPPSLMYGGSPAPAVVPPARHGESKTPPLILRFSAHHQGVTDHPGSTPLRDLLRRIAQ